MQTRTTNNTTRQIADFLKSLDRAAATTHNGDADAIGSAAALVCLDTGNHQDNPLYGRLNLVDASAAASTQIVAALYAEAGVPLSREAAEAIYADVFTDTGGFRFRNISPAAHELVAKLLRLGVIPAEVNERINRTGTIEQMNVVGVSMANAELYGEALISIVGEEDYERTGASELDSKEAIDLLRSVSGVEVVGYLRQVEGGTKASLRSESVDIGEIARLFGGGGHRLAAGYTTPKSPEEAREELLAALRGLVDLGEDTYIGEVKGLDRLSLIRSCRETRTAQETDMFEKGGS